MKRLLIANRGEIACRIARTARAMGIATVAVYSDADAGAPHVRACDVAVRLPGAAPADTYLRADLLVDAARRTGADAVHPGYGFLSEQAGFARACADAGLVFVGPSPEVIERMGSKIAAKELMAAAGVPVLGRDGYPLLVKAAFGGGGRGMRIVRDPSELDEALAAAGREAASAFGDGTVFVERYVERPRHIEVQILGDTHGNVIHLFERECSIQRRYQKVIEEAPSPFVGPELRARLCSAAVAAGRALGYVGAGTVEFVVDPAGDFFFLEVNTRLQVEHPVTESVTGLDLVEWQLRIARGEPITVSPALDGWAIEARLYAEDVAAGFVPCAGRLERFELPAADGVRVDSGYETGSVVSTHYDAMLAKVIAGGRTRDEAIGRLTASLGGARVHGVPTNRDLLLGVLRHDAFRAGAIDTGFLDCYDDLRRPDRSGVPVAAAAAALARQAQARRAVGVQVSIPSGWRNVPSALQRRVFMVDDAAVTVEYGPGRHRWTVVVDGGELDAVVHTADAELVDLAVDGVRARYLVAHSGSDVWVDGPGVSIRLTEVDRLPEPGSVAAPGSLLAPMPGVVTRVLVGVGDTVTTGQVLVVMEAMKMEHRVVSGADGTVTMVAVAVGQQVSGGDVLAVVEGDD